MARNTCQMVASSECVSAPSGQPKSFPKSLGDVVSIFCGAGGLDLGFEQCGFNVPTAYDIRASSIDSYNANRHGALGGHVADVRSLTVGQIQNDAAIANFAPIGLIGGPPCQSFSGANTVDKFDDPRHSLPEQYARLVHELNLASPLHFFAFENVVGLVGPKHAHVFEKLKKDLEEEFNLSEVILDAHDFGLPQHRRRVIVVGFNKSIYGELRWIPPEPTAVRATVRDAIGDLPEPVHFERSMSQDAIPFHPNHWCMKPKSEKFKNGQMSVGSKNRRCFKVLSWHEPSPTVAYGNREVHVHPGQHRRLSVLEAMKLQGFPEHFILKGTLSSQITQVSEAVPPPLAFVIAESIKEQLKLS
ncbi:Modification methylase HaeIII [Xanthomonas hydrangeae]|uniref:DNA cytosine methyltransferase n=1 Tax=Xanthomonas hydrangeae TaxID=2775159 RepID=UPI001AF6A27A|nr:Modification methylase HaeIII [Xanthomonas hydrangeae]CAD7713576.1 Modification methylase HaeIII [Xanthomonas hydrangeae]CAD7720325.1 Modification methylase HaeIII [Xanthomonas hydrangeae]CAD7720329.1 Modification methylase HaeIII [Xanthomonas hydrangeae]